MKKIFVVLAIMMAMVVLSAGTVLAGNAHVDGDGTAIGFDNNVRNDINNANTNLNNLSNNQTQGQWEWQTQSSVNTNNVNATGGNAHSMSSASNGNQTTTVGGQKMINEYKRTAPAGSASGFVFASGFASISEGIDLCETPYGQLYAHQYSIDDIQLMADSSGGSRRGNFFEKLFTGRTSTSGHVPDRFKAGSGSPVRVLCMANICPDTSGLMTINVEGKYGQGPEEALGGALLLAAENGASNVVATVAMRLDPKANASSLGLGSATTFTVGFSMGTTATSMYKAYDVTLRVVSPQACMVAAPARELPPPPPPPVVYEQRRRPQPMQDCDAEEIRREIEREEGIFCPNFTLDNFKRNLRIASLDIEEYVCIGDKTFLEEKYVVEESGKTYNGAIGHFRRAEKTLAHLRGREREEARAEMIEAYKDWATSINVVQGRAAAMSFAKKHKTEFQQGFGK